jgi:hypothetical protein
MLSKRVLPLALSSMACMLLALMLTGCNQKKKPRLDDLSAEEARQYTWHSDWDSTLLDIVFVRGEKMDSFDITPGNLVLLLNKQDPYDVSFIKISVDTLFAAINNSQRLGEQMGSAGAHEYLGVVTLTFSEVEHINLVYLDFTEGSHATPGIYTREDFLLTQPILAPLINPLPL